MTSFASKPPVRRPSRLLSFERRKSKKEKGSAPEVVDVTGKVRSAAPLPLAPGWEVMVDPNDGSSYFLEEATGRVSRERRARFGVPRGVFCMARVAM